MGMLAKCFYPTICGICHRKGFEMANLKSILNSRIRHDHSGHIVPAFVTPKHVYEIPYPIVRDIYDLRGGCIVFSEYYGEQEVYVLCAYEGAEAEADEVLNNRCIENCMYYMLTSWDEIDEFIREVFNIEYLTEDPRVDYLILNENDEIIEIVGNNA